MTPAVLVVNFGSHGLVAANLGRTALPGGALVVVVDNFSSPEERLAMTRLAHDHGWLLELPAANLGFGAGMNLAADRAVSEGADVLVALNPDAWVQADGILRLADLAATSRSTQVAPVVRRPDGRHFSSLMEVDLARGRTRRVRDGSRYDSSALWVSGACFAVSVELWRSVGGFDDDYFLYWEDVDFSVRVQAGGGTVVAVPEVGAVHAQGGTQGGQADRKSPVYFRYNARGRLVFGSKHRAPGTAAAWLAHTPAATWELLLRGGRRQLLRPARAILPALGGVASGLRYFLRGTWRARAAGRSRTGVIP